MKHVFIVAVAASVLTACTQSSSMDDNASLLRSEKDSLAGVKKEITQKIAKIEEELALLDTSQEFTLVKTFKPEVRTFRHYFTVHGVVETDKNATVFAESRGRIESIKVKEGERVSKGQVLMVLDAELIRKNIDEMETRLELAQTVYERQKKLWGKNIGSEMQYLEAKNNRDALNNSLQTLQEQLDQATVKAPFSGVVDELFPKEGEMASPGVRLARLINLDKVYIKADVAENYLSLIEEGDSVLVRFPSLNGEVIKTDIDRIGQFINPNNRTFKVRVDVNNGSGMLKPNLLAEIDILDYENDSTVVIPANYIMQGAEGLDYVFVVSDGEGSMTAEKREITLGRQYKGETEVIAGLTGTEQIISKGARSIQNGELVEITN